MQKILWSFLCIVLMSGQKQSHPNEEENAIGVKWRELLTMGKQKNQRSMDVCVHVVMQMIYLGISGVIFLRNNYNFDIPAVGQCVIKNI